MSVRCKEQETYGKYCCTRRESIEVFHRENAEKIGDEGCGCLFKGKLISIQIPWCRGTVRFPSVENQSRWI